MRIGPEPAGSSRRRFTRVLPWLLLGLALAYFLLSMRWATANDLKVYAYGAQSVLEGRPVYLSMTPGTSASRLMPDQVFTYPPFAAVTFIPFALLPLPVLAVVWWLTSLALLAAACFLIARSVRGTCGVALPYNDVQMTALVLAGALMMEPTIINAQLGQINVVIMLLVLIDALVPWRFRGALTGVAAGLKIVPAAFVVLMLLTRRWAETIRAAAAFAATVVVGLVIGPAQVWDYWTRYLWDTDRVGDPGRNDNQSLLADLIHVDRSGAHARLLWLISSVVVVVVGYWLAARLWRYDRLLSTVTVAVIGLTVSPISWTHHWIWATPLAAGLAAVGVRLRRNGQSRAAATVWIVSGVLGAGMMVGPITVIYRVLGHGVPGAGGKLLIVLGSNGYLILAGAAMLVLLWIGWRAPGIWRDRETSDADAIPSGPRSVAVNEAPAGRLAPE